MKKLVLIPSFKPDERLLEFVKALKNLDLKDVLIVDDGSGIEYEHIYKKLREEYTDCEVIYHSVNLGKGRALKTGFNHALNKYPNLIGVVACDADGQHPADVVKKAADMMEKHPDKLILGTRRFGKGKNVPLSNLMGNMITILVFKLLTGLFFSDTQCGLRAFPNSVMKKLLKTKGEGFEFENIMLIDLRKDNIGYVEIPMDAIYFEEEKQTSHFNKLKDSFIIYKSILTFALLPVFAGIMAYLTTMLLFNIAPLCNLLKTGLIYMVGLLVGWFIMFIPENDDKAKWYTMVLPLVHSALFSVVFYWLLNFRGIGISGSWWLTAILAGPSAYAMYLRLRFGKKPERVKIK